MSLAALALVMAAIAIGGSLAVELYDSAVDLLNARRERR